MANLAGKYPPPPPPPKKYYMEDPCCSHKVMNIDTKQSTQNDVKILFFFYSWSFGVLLWEIESGGITESINNQVKFIQGCLVLFYQSSIQNGHFNAPLHGWTMLNKNFRQHQLTQCMHAQTRPTMLHPSTLDILLNQHVCLVNCKRPWNCTSKDIAPSCSPWRRH